MKERLGDMQNRMRKTEMHNIELFENVIERMREK